MRATAMPIKERASKSAELPPSGTEAGGGGLASEESTTAKRSPATSVSLALFFMILLILPRSQAHAIGTVAPSSVPLVIANQGFNDLPLQNLKRILTRKNCKALRRCSLLKASGPHAAFVPHGAELGVARRLRLHQLSGQKSDKRNLPGKIEAIVNPQDDGITSALNFRVTPLASRACRLRDLM